MFFSKKITLIAILALQVSTSAFASQSGKVIGTFAPPNDRKIPVNGKWADSGGISKDAFDAVIAKMVATYSPIVSSQGAVLQFENKWSDATVNSQARRSGNTWYVDAFGGLARHPMMTADAMMMVFCHEMGHHLGGAPKAKSLFFSSWASNEGQSDYFATMKCWRRMTQSDDNAKIVGALTIPKVVSDLCEKTQTSLADIAICERGSMVGLELATILWDLGKTSNSNVPAPSFSTPDGSQVSTTDNNHPEAQCRLDTYFAGAVCGVAYSAEFDKKDPTISACNQEKGDLNGYRPRCWYKPAAH